MPHREDVIMPTYDERWMGDGQTAELARLAGSTNHLAGEVVEIGTWQGLSAIPIANAIRPASLHVVDHWQGDGAAIPAELVARDNYGIFLANAAEAGVTVIVHKMGWREWVKDWTAPIRFLHLDAAHTTEEVADNIAAILPFMVPGGILAGDDWDWPDVEAGILRHLTRPENIMWDKLWWKVMA
jgi:predicted O-methyltransferase YrrM